MDIKISDIQPDGCRMDIEGIIVDTYEEAFKILTLLGEIRRIHREEFKEGVERLKPVIDKLWKEE